MLKTLLLALFAVCLDSGNGSAVENGELYASLLPSGKPFFEIFNENVPQTIHITKEGQNRLIFQIPRSNAEVTFRLHERTYTVPTFKIEFDEKDEASLEINFEERHATQSPTRILIRTKITAGSNDQNAIPIQVLSAGDLDYLLGQKTYRQKIHSLSLEWIAELTRTKKPMFNDFRRKPATLQFAEPTIKVDNEVWGKLQMLKENLKNTFAENFLKTFSTAKR